MHALVASDGLLIPVAVAAACRSLVVEIKELCA